MNLVYDLQGRQIANEKNFLLREILLIKIQLLLSPSVVPDSLRPHGQQHTRLPCPSSSPRACSNSYPLSQGYYPMISSSVAPFSSCPQSFPASGSFRDNGMKVTDLGNDPQWMQARQGGRQTDRRCL